MVRLLLLLLGTGYTRRFWRRLVVVGVLLQALGVFLFIDSLDELLIFPLRLFGIVLLIEGLGMTVLAFAAVGTLRRIFVARGLFVSFSAVLVVVGGTVSDFLLSLFFGLAFVLHGALRIAAGSVVRFKGWRVSLLAGVVEVALGGAILHPTLVPWFETVEFVTAFMTFLGGWALARVGLLLRSIPPGKLTPLGFSRGWHEIDEVPAAAWATDVSHAPLIVHVWTAEGTIEDPVSRPIVNRYVAAVDRKGVVSTGHSATELPGHFYASHYPAVEIDRSPDQFGRALRATADNNVPGRFQPSYAEEAAGWCESVWKVRFPEFNAGRVKAWWSSYSRDQTYNLTSRSCSTTTAHLLETALEGVIGRRNPGLFEVGRLALSPTVWLAGQIREHAEAMAWTPGLVLDYARNLRASLEPPPLPDRHLVRVVIQTMIRSFRR